MDKKSTVQHVSPEYNNHCSLHRLLLLQDEIKNKQIEPDEAIDTQEKSRTHPLVFYTRRRVSQVVPYPERNLQTQVQWGPLFLHWTWNAGSESRRI